MDPFEVRMQFLSLLRRLTASQQSIQKVVAYALKYFSRCGDLIWDCIVEECQKGSLNTRINILYLLDSLCEASLLSKASFGPSSSSGGGSSNGNFYIDFVARDLANIVEYVVPPGREGLINLMSAVQVLENWRNKRTLDPQKVEEVLTKLESQKSNTAASNTHSSTQDGPHIEIAQVSITGEADTGSGGESLAFSRNEIFKRIEEDRERHKRLRERRWVQPLVYEKNVPILASFAPLPSEHEQPVPTPSGEPSSGSATDADPNAPPNGSTTPSGSLSAASELPLDIEFDNAWETTSDWNEDDDEAIGEENNLCYPNAAVRYGENPSAPPPHSLDSSGEFEPGAPSTTHLVVPPSGPGPGPGPAPSSSRSKATSTAKPGVTSTQPTSAPASAHAIHQKRPIKIDRSRLTERRVL